MVETSWLDSQLIFLYWLILFTCFSVASYWRILHSKEWTRLVDVWMFSCFTCIDFWGSYEPHTISYIRVFSVLSPKYSPSEFRCRVSGANLEIKNKFSTAVWKSANYWTFHWDFIDNTIHRLAVLTSKSATGYVSWYSYL